MCLFSFIIPVYNAAATLGRCLDSILERSTSDYEILLINDSSTDNSLEICECYANKYSQVTVYTYPNSGAGAARNRGLEKAQGKYVLFCDSDDWYNTKELNTLLDSANAEMTDIDLICFDYRKKWIDCFEETKHFDKEFLELNNKAERVLSVSSSILSTKCGIIIWNKIYKKELLDKNKILFPERDKLGNLNDWGEDLCFNILYLLVCHRIQIIEAPVYVNCLRTTKSGTEEHYYYKKSPLDHISKMLLSLTDTYIFQRYSKDNFNDIFLYSIYSYFLWSTQSSNIKNTREIFYDIDNVKVVSKIIISKLFYWNKFSKNRFSKYKSKEYKFILFYCITGNMFFYKTLCKLFL